MRSVRFVPTRALILACATILAGSSTPAMAAEQPRPEAACAAYDLHLLTLIEDSALTGSGASDALAEAAMRIADARTACRTREFERALRLYQSVDLRSAPATSFYQVGLQ
jgi:hypothetical protein